MFPKRIFVIPKVFKSSFKILHKPGYSRTSIGECLLAIQNQSLIDQKCENLQIFNSVPIIPIMRHLKADSGDK